MQPLETDVLVIGGGLAGLRSAIEAAKHGIRTTVVSKSLIGVGSNSALAGGGFSMATPEFSVEDHIKTTLEAGKNLNDRELVQELVLNGTKEGEFLRNAGVDLIPQPFGYLVDKMGKLMGGRIVIRKLTQEALRCGQIQFFPNFYVYKILMQDNQVSGVIGITKEGSPCLIHAKAVILATGGGGAIYKRNDNHKGILGDGYALAMEIGLPLFDMEFIQFYPFGFAEPGLPQGIIYPPFPEEAKMVDAEGNDFLKKYGIEMDLYRFMVSSRDKACYLMYKELETGKVFMDYTRVPDKKWSEYPLNLFPKRRFNFKEKPFQIAPVAHFFMGGVEIKPSGETDIRGLFAAGEVTSGVHGANRLGGNALTECLVFGAKSGLSASEYAKKHAIKKTPFNLEKWFKPFMEGKTKFKTRREIFNLLKSIREIAWRYVGPIRNEAAMREALSLLEGVAQNLQNLRVNNPSELITKKEAENSLLVVKTIIFSSLARQGSLGAFQREDYPQECESEFRKRISVRMSEGRPELEVRMVSHPGKSPVSFLG